MSGNVTGGNLVTAGLANVAGNIDGGNIRTLGIVSSAGNVTAPNFIGNVVGNISGNLTAPGANTQVIFNDSSIANATANLTFDKTTNAFAATGTITGGNLATGGTVSAAGDTVLAGNLAVGGSTSYLNATNLAIKDPIVGVGRGANNAALSSNDGFDRGQQLFYYSTAEKSAFIGYDQSAGKLIAAQEVGITNEVVTVSSYGTFLVGALEGSTVSATGNISRGNVLGGANVNATTRTGTTVSVSGNIVGVANVNATTHTGTTVSVTGNITGGNVLGGANVNATTHTGTTVSVTGNITGGNVLGGANVNATTHTGTTVSVSGNITGGNLTTAGLTSTASLSVTGNTATVTTASYQIGYRDLPQISTFGTLVADAGGKHYYGSGTITIPASGTLNFAIGTAILIIASGATTVSPAGGVTLIQAGTAASGTRTLATAAVASLVKVTTDGWYISGVGIS